MVGVDFDRASNEYVAVGALTGSDVAADWTFECWFNQETDVVGMKLAQFDTNAGNRQYGLGISQTAGWRFAIFYPTGTGVNDFNVYTWTATDTLLGTWQHLALVFVAADLGWRLYIDGTDYGLAAPADFSPGSVSGTFVLQLGRQNDTASSTNTWNGKLAQCAIYPSALSATRIAVHVGKTYNGYSEQLTSARITAVLDLAGWPSALRDLDTEIQYNPPK